MITTLTYGCLAVISCEPGVTDTCPGVLITVAIGTIAVHTKTEVYKAAQRRQQQQQQQGPLSLAADRQLRPLQVIIRHRALVLILIVLISQYCYNRLI
jgi:hypothetical protein